MSPKRIQLRRTKGWRMPPNTVKVDRTTIFGNPFVVGRDGTAAECVYWFVLLCCGYLNLSMRRECIYAQELFRGALKAEIDGGFTNLRGRNLGCWCGEGKPCHADIVLTIANRRKGARRTLDLDAIMAGYGYRVENGRVMLLEIANS